ncbi:MAG: hypothetical protein AB3N16_08140 [Flavobacteriaceae bacterium]
MAVLKKIQASTLMETLVATVLIVLVFMVSSLILNNLFANSITFNENEVRQELLRLQYQYQNELLQVPYESEMGDWEISVSKEDRQGRTQLSYLAVNKANNRELNIRR